MRVAFLGLVLLGAWIVHGRESVDSSTHIVTVQTVGEYRGQVRVRELQTVVNGMPTVMALP